MFLFICWPILMDSLDSQHDYTKSRNYYYLVIYYYDY